MILDYNRRSSVLRDVEMSFLGCLRRLYANEGFAGLYKGYLAGLIGVSHGAVQFMSYERIKSILIKYKSLKEKPDEGFWRQAEKAVFGHIHLKAAQVEKYKEWSALETVCMSILSKTFASVTTYPYQVIRSRLQAPDTQYQSTLDCCVKMLQNEGIRGFYRGIFINTVKVIPSATIVFLVYEKVQQLLKYKAKQNYFYDTQLNRSSIYNKLPK